MVAKSDNNVIGLDTEIPWKVKGEQLLFKAMTYNQWILVGRKTFHAMGKLPNRKYAVISRSVKENNDEDVVFFESIEKALTFLSGVTDHVVISGGGQIYRDSISMVDVIHISIIHSEVNGNIFFPEIPGEFKLAFSQDFTSNINYTYQIWTRGKNL